MEGTLKRTIVPIKPGTWGRAVVRAVVLGALALAAGCQTAPEPRTPAPDAPPTGIEDTFAPPVPSFTDRPVRIAVLLPLSGANARVGQQLLNAAGLALFDAYDPRLVLLPYDTRGTPGGAAAAAQRAVADGAELMLGPLFAGSVRAAAEAVRDSGINLIGLSNDRAVAGDGVFLMGFMPDQEATRVIAHATAQGYARFAALLPDDAYGERVLDGFGRAIADTGAAVTAIEVYPRDRDALAGPVKRLADYDARRRAYEQETAFLEGMDDDFSREILKQLETQETLGEVSFDAVMLAEGSPLVRTLAPLLPFYEIDPEKVRFLGTGLWEERALTREPALRGAWFAAPDPAQPTAFFERYQELYGERPARLATLGYDAMALAATLARNEIRLERFSADALTDPNGFLGLDGAFRFTTDGVAERQFAVLEIGPKGFSVIDPAPTTFQQWIGMR